MRSGSIPMMRENAMRYRPSWKRRACMSAAFGRRPVFQSTRIQRSPSPSSVRNTASMRPRRLTPSTWVSTGYSTAQMRSFHSGEPHSLAAKRSQSERTEESCSLSSARDSSSKRASCGISSANSRCSSPATSSGAVSPAGSTAPGRVTPSVSSASGASSGSALGTTPKCSSMRACTSVPMVAAREGRCGTGRNSSCTVPCGSSLRRMNVEAER